MRALGPAAWRLFVRGVIRVYMPTPIVAALTTSTSPATTGNKGP